MIRNRDEPERRLILFCAWLPHALRLCFRDQPAYIPFVLIDLAVASVLMSLGMIMVSPTLISLPLKLLMFVSIHGWVLVLGTLANSFVLPGY
jgi:flagellar biosynthesis protein FliP